MKTSYRQFEAGAENRAFLEGVEFVNDSAVVARLDWTPGGNQIVVIEDQDGEEDDSDEYPKEEGLI